MQKYKAIISDIDGTLTPISEKAMPSEKVIQAVKLAQESGIAFSLATGRPYFLVEHLVKLLELKSPIITDNGAVIIDAGTGDILWEALIPSEDINKLLLITKSYPLTRFSCHSGIVENPTEISEDVKVRKIAIQGLEIDEAEKLVKKLENEFKNLAIVRAAAYEGKEFLDVYVTNAEATKQHAVLKYMQILGLSKDDVIAIGDHYNDFPLFMACGFKVAMGNAVEDLKAIADYVAPSVDDDGVAHVINKFILK